MQVYKVISHLQVFKNLNQAMFSQQFYIGQLLLILQLDNIRYFNVFSKINLINYLQIDQWKKLYMPKYMRDV